MLIFDKTENEIFDLSKDIPSTSNYFLNEPETCSLNAINIFTNGEKDFGLSTENGVASSSISIDSATLLLNSKNQRRKRQRV